MLRYGPRPAGPALLDGRRRYQTFVTFARDANEWTVNGWASLLGAS